MRIVRVRHCSNCAAKIRLSRVQKQILFAFCRDEVSKAQPKIRQSFETANIRVHGLRRGDVSSDLSAGRCHPSRGAETEERGCSDEEFANFFGIILLVMKFCLSLHTL